MSRTKPTPYGYHLILDIHDANAKMFTRRGLRRFFKIVCEEIGMVRAKLVFWGYWNPWAKRKAPAHLKGISAVQFIMTSSIVIHALDDGRIYIDIFSCKTFDPVRAVKVVRQCFGGVIKNQEWIGRT